MLLRTIRTLLLLAIAAVLFLAYWISKELSVPQSFPEKRSFFEVPKGSGAGAIARKLKESGLIKKKSLWTLEYRLFFHPRHLKAGEYVFESPLLIKDILSAMIEGNVYLHPLTIPEGLTGKEISDCIQAQGLASEEEFFQAFRNTEPIASWDYRAENLEGYLFPETYHFPRRTEAAQIIAAMVTQFQAIFDEARRRRADELGLSIREVVILASLVEKETALKEEKPLVSAVFHNRLRRGMKLDCDPTIIYALKQQNAFEGRLHSKDLELDSPYNTYLYAGLPPGPICNPGRSSLEAALYPAAETYLYFVSRNDGSHSFSRTLAEHLAAVNLFQKRTKPRPNRGE
jgi:UPF0755 protein